MQFTNIFSQQQIMRKNNNILYTDESTHGSSIVVLRGSWLSGDTIEERVWVWLSCDMISKALNLMASSIPFRFTTDGWTGIFPSNIFTTADMAGLSDGDGFVHSRATSNILIASFLE